MPFVHDPVGVTGQVAAGIWGDLISADLWEDHPAEASGRVTFEAVSLLLPVLKIGKLAKAGKAGEFAKAESLDGYFSL